MEQFLVSAHDLYTKKLAYASSSSRMYRIHNATRKTAIEIAASHPAKQYQHKRCLNKYTLKKAKTNNCTLLRIIEIVERTEMTQ